MGYRIELRHPDCKSVGFEAQPNQNLLTAAYDNGYVLASTCLRGGCGACRAVIVAGDISQLEPMSRTHCEDPDSGEITHQLLCVAAAASDLIIEPENPWQLRLTNPLSARLTTRDQVTTK